ncbi:MAG TPA: hypothetical protein VJV78_13190 [Polyangiales bacterium]|nr:hypothetical protein [Polyangiales bacterium]
MNCDFAYTSVFMRPYVPGEAAAGDNQALMTLMSIHGLVAPLELLRQSPRPERLAASAPTA